MSNERSKFLALILRHKPQMVGVKLLKEGWCDIEKLIENSDFTFEELVEIVNNDNKGRYQISSDKKFIRAVQGHSTNVKITFKEYIPKDQLYHGTAEKYFNSILKDGIKKMNRQFVHLSSNVETAIKVGERHGKVKIFAIDAKKMYKDGYKFFIAENGVILTDYVPTEYLIY